MDKFSELVKEPRSRLLAISIYLLLTKFEVRTVSYGPSFFPFAYGPCAKREKARIRNFSTVRTERTRLLRYLLYL